MRQCGQQDAAWPPLDDLRGKQRALDDWYINHTTCYRGYIADTLYRVPANPPTTDLTVFIRDMPQELDRFPDLAALP